MDVINWVAGLDWTNIGNIVLQIVGLAAMVSSITPNQADDKFVQLILDGLNSLGFNLSRSKNA